MHAADFSSDRLTNSETTPALIAAKNLLKLSLGVEPSAITGDSAQFQSDDAVQALVQLVNSQTDAICDGSVVCDAVKVSKKVSVFGHTVELTRYGFINSTATNTDGS